MQRASRTRWSEAGWRSAAQRIDKTWPFLCGEAAAANSRFEVVESVACNYQMSIQKFFELSNGPGVPAARHLIGSEIREATSDR